MPKDEAGPVNPLGVSKSGARAGGDIFLARGGSFLLALLEEGDEVGELVDSSLMGKRIERLLPSRENTGSSLARNLGVLGLAFPHLKPTASSRSGGSGDEPARILGRRVVNTAL